MSRILFWLLLFAVGQQVMAQHFYTLSGTVKDLKTDKTISGATVTLSGMPKGVFTDTDGKYNFDELKNGQYQLVTNSVGYENDTIHVDLDRNKTLDIHLSTAAIQLDEVVVRAHRHSSTHIRAALADKSETNFSKLLATVPGVATMDIGAGVSKPLIRGLGFNRIAVVNKGIVQQNQQWGADHGLQINQFDMEYATIHKGANSLMFGSDAMAGAVEIKPEGFGWKSFRNNADSLWAEPLFKGSVLLKGASNNDLFGGAFVGVWQKHNYFVRAIYDHQDYADYRVPASEFSYLSYNFPIHNRRLKNTAGKEQSISLSAGYLLNKNLWTIFNVSDNYQKNGFFAGAHGIPDISKLEPDASVRNVDMPYTTANHFSITNNTQWKNSTMRLLVNSAYQSNRRKEQSYYHTHYGSQTPPNNIDPDLELDFDLKTYSSNVRFFLDEDKAWKKTIGAGFEYQNNEVAGYNFFLPQFDQITGGLFALSTYDVNNKTTLSGGLRYDIGKIDITGFYDPSLAKYLTDKGHTPAQVEENAWRAYDNNRNFGSFSGAFGIKYLTENNFADMLLTTNVGKSFRFPTAVELASNGVHHGAFRHEVGNPNLDAENGYSADVSFTLTRSESYQIDISLFGNYFSNFIYLQPSLQWSLLPDAGQYYNYQQAKAIFGGGEYSLSWNPVREIKLTTEGEYVINENIDTHYPLPFTPPFTMKNEVSYSKYLKSGNINYYSISLSHQWFADQSRIANGEEKTAGANLFNLTFNLDYRISKKSTIQFNIQARNIFDTRYFNHLSFYRKLNIPEPGRNMQISVKIPINS